MFDKGFSDSFSRGIITLPNKAIEKPLYYQWNFERKFDCANQGRAILASSLLRFKASTLKGLAFSLRLGKSIVGNMLTAFATGFALQYCRLIKVWVLYEP